MNKDDFIPKLKKQFEIKKDREVPKKKRTCQIKSVLWLLQIIRVILNGLDTKLETISKNII